MSLSVFDRDFMASACPICDTHCKGAHVAGIFPPVKKEDSTPPDEGRTVKIDEPIS